MRLVVIGGVAAGLSAAARARRLDPSLEIVVLEKAAEIAWSACGLPYFIEGQTARLDNLVIYTPERFARDRNVTVRTGAEVAAISHGRREVVTASGDRVHYDKLVVATGARAERSSQPQTFGLQTMDDARRLDQFIREHNPRTAAVAGAGYIGLEVAGALRTRGLRVSVYQGSSDVLGREDRELTQAIQRHLARFDIELFLDSHSGPRSADLVVMATGMRPNVGLAADAGIEIGRTGAIRVTDRMETNINGIWAAGDCAEAHHIVTGRPAYVPLGTTANKMGRVAGANVAGARERFPGIVGTSIVSICGLAVGLTGLSEAQAAREGFSPVSARIESGDKPRYFRPQETTVELVADRSSRRILGGSVIGGRGVEGRVNIIAAALHGRLKMDEFEHLDMAYAPPFAPVWDPLLIAAQQLLKKL